MGARRASRHYPFMVALHTGLFAGCLARGVARRPAVLPGARLADARLRRRGAGAAVVVHPHARAAVEHPHRRGAGLARVTGGPVSVLRPSRTTWPSSSRVRAAAGAHRVDHRRHVHGAQRGAAHRADPRRERRPARARASMHDVLVAGGGPAGLAVAIGAARAGLDVVVVRAPPGPIDKACGEGLMPGARAALLALGVDPPGHDIRGITYRRRRRGRAGRRSAAVPGGSAAHRLHDALRAAVEPPPASRCCSGRSTDVRAGRRPRVRPATSGRGTWSPPTGCTPPIRRRPAWRSGRRPAAAVGPAAALRDRAVDRPRRGHWAARLRGLCDAGRPTNASASPSSPASRAGFDEQLAAFPALAARLAGPVPASAVRGAGPLRQRVSGARRRPGAAGRRRRRLRRRADRRGHRRVAGGGRGTRHVPDGRPAGPLRRAWRRVSRRSRWLTSGLLWARRRPALARSVVPVAVRLPGVFAAAVNQLAG